MKSRKPFIPFLSQCLAVSILILGLTTPAVAETYIGVGAGVSFSGSYEDNRISDTSGNLLLTASDLDAQESAAFGFRIGHYFTFLPWLGVEFQWYRRALDADSQNITLSGSTTAAAPFSTLGTGTGQIVTDNMDTWGFMVNVRGTKEMFPSLGNFEPYGGIGLALNSIDIERLSTNITSTTPNVSGSGSDSDTDAGFLVQLGTDYLLTERLNAFAEYKYTGANFTFNKMATGFTTETDYSDHTFMLGLKYTLFE